MTLDRVPATIPGMGDDLAAFLADYAEACRELAVDPLPLEALAELAALVLAGLVAGAQPVH